MQDQIVQFALSALCKFQKPERLRFLKRAQSEAQHLKQARPEGPNHFAPLGKRAGKRLERFTRTATHLYDRRSRARLTRPHGRAASKALARARQTESLDAIDQRTARNLEHLRGARLVAGTRFQRLNDGLALELR